MGGQKYFLPIVSCWENNPHNLPWGDVQMIGNDQKIKFPHTVLKVKLSCKCVLAGTYISLKCEHFFWHCDSSNCMGSAVTGRK